MRIRLTHIVGRPALSILEPAVCVIAKDTTVVFLLVLARHEVDVSTVEYCTIIALGAQSVCAPGVVGRVAVGVFERKVSVVAKDDPVGFVGFIMLRCEVDVAAVE